MVYVQRPDATVLAGFEQWMELNLPVMRGSKGIAVFPSKLFGENVTHVFDVSDTKGKVCALELDSKRNQPPETG